MSLIKPSSILISHFIWQFHLLGYFLRQAKRAVILTTGLRIFSQFAQLFSLFIPLKIILILGQNALPSFAQNSMEGISLDAWIVILTITTLMLYMLSILGDLTANQISGRAAKQFSKSINITEGNQKLAAEMLTTACNAYANFTVIILGAIGMLILNPLILLCILVIALGQLAITDLICGFEDGVLGWIKRRIHGKPADYVNYLSATNFLFVFIAILIGYRITGSIDTLVAILTLLLARKIFQSISQLARQSIKLFKIDNDTDKKLSLVFDA